MNRPLEAMTHLERELFFALVSILRITRIFSLPGSILQYGFAQFK